MFGLVTLFRIAKNCGEFLMTSSIILAALSPEARNRFSSNACIACIPRPVGVRIKWPGVVQA